MVRTKFRSHNEEKEHTIWKCSESSGWRNEIDNFGGNWGTATRFIRELCSAPLRTCADCETSRIFDLVATLWTLSDEIGSLHPYPSLFVLPCCMSVHHVLHIGATDFSEIALFTLYSSQYKWNFGSEQKKILSPFSAICWAIDPTKSFWHSG